MNKNPAVELGWISREQAKPCFSSAQGKASSPGLALGLMTAWGSKSKLLMDTNTHTHTHVHTHTHTHSRWTLGPGAHTG